MIALKDFWHYFLQSFYPRNTNTLICKFSASDTRDIPITFNRILSTYLPTEQSALHV